MKTSKIIKDNLNDMQFRILLELGIQYLGIQFYLFHALGQKTPQKSTKKSHFRKAILGISGQLFPVMLVQLPFT